MKKIMKGVVFGLACNCLFSGVTSGMEKIKFEGLKTNCYAVCETLRNASPEKIQRVLRDLPANYWEYRVFVHAEEFLAILSTGNFELVRLACGDDVYGALSDAVYCLGKLYEVALDTKNAQIIEFIQKNTPKIDYESYVLRRNRFKNLEEVHKAIIKGKMKI